MQTFFFWNSENRFYALKDKLWILHIANTIAWPIFCFISWLLLNLAQDEQTFPVKGPKVNILGFVGHWSLPQPLNSAVVVQKEPLKIYKWMSMAMFQ